jgi:hypothetical protein
MGMCMLYLEGLVLLESRDQKCLREKENKGTKEETAIETMVKRCWLMSCWVVMMSLSNSQSCYRREDYIIWINTYAISLDIFAQLNTCQSCIHTRNHSLFPKSSSSARPLGRECVTWNNTPKSLMFLVFRETQTNKALSEIVLLNVA